MQFSYTTELDGVEYNCMLECHIQPVDNEVGIDKAYLDDIVLLEVLTENEQQHSLFTLMQHLNENKGDIEYHLFEHLKEEAEMCKADYYECKDAEFTCTLCDL
jgi:hypothetical protein